MDQQMRRARLLVAQAPTERQDLLDVADVRRSEPRLLLDHVVEAQLEPGVLAKGAEGWRLGRRRVEDRQDVADADVAVAGKLVDAADRCPERHGFQATARARGGGRASR